ncbi:MAG TPA: outer membrane beta-barrel protein [Pyrinomonadaceae bacterium]|nr:outer membrane beta-barrel protein [Pyrinomonadaceae bacterium]
MKTRALFTLNALVLFLLLPGRSASAQEQETPKLEVGVQYSSLSINLPGFFRGGTETAVGVGGRVTYNFNDYFAVEAEGNLSPSNIPSDYVTGGASQQVQAGVKVGRRWRRFGLFAKARPGLVSFGETLTPTEATFGGDTFVQFRRERKTHFSMDVGGVLEFYPSKRTLVRFDAGDTIIRYGEHQEGFTFASPVGAPLIFTAPSETRHNFQFTAGVGFRFGGGVEDAGAPQSSTAGEGVRRFEVGIQFSSLVLRAPGDGRFEENASAEAGGGLRFGVNATDNLAFEVEGNFYPRRTFGNSTAVGGYPSQAQAGVKYGRRFRRFGVFGKARPGVMHFSSVAEVSGYEAFPFLGGDTFFFPNFRFTGKTYFSMDVGGVFEFYPTRRLLTRFDVGDTMIRYPSRDNPTGFLNTPPPRLPAELRHNLQVTAGIGWRF